MKRPFLKIQAKPRGWDRERKVWSRCWTQEEIVTKFTQRWRRGQEDKFPDCPFFSQQKPLEVFPGTPSAIYSPKLFQRLALPLPKIFLPAHLPMLHLPLWTTASDEDHPCAFPRKTLLMPVNAPTLTRPMDLQAVLGTPHAAPRISQLSKKPHEEINLQLEFFHFSLLTEE